MDVLETVARYAAGWFPMDDQHGQPELPWYAVEHRAIFELDPVARERLRRRVRRSLRASEDLHLWIDGSFEEVLGLCADPPPGEGVWITDRMKALYRALHAEGWAHSFELIDDHGTLCAGILGVVVGRAAMLESMRHTRSEAGNALLSRTLDLLAARGIELCDIQTPTDHTLSLGAVLIAREEYGARLARAVGVT